MIPGAITRVAGAEEKAEVTKEKLFEAGLIRSLKHPVKILGTGDVHHALFVKTDRLSAPARKKILSAGGEVKEI